MIRYKKVGKTIYRRYGNSNYWYKEKKQKSQSPMTGYKEYKNIVYIIKVENSDIYKIGHTRDLKTMNSRFLIIKAYCPLIIKILGYIKCTDAILTEGKIHKEFKRFRIHHEWFRLDDNCINQIKKQAGYTEIKQ